MGPPPLSKVDQEPAGTNCPLGGVRVSLGADSNGDGKLDESEVSSTSYVCDKVDGPVLQVVGKVISPEGTPVAGASVRICGIGSVTTDAEGRFSMPSRLAWTYQMEASISAPGFASRHGLIVDDDDTALGKNYFPVRFVYDAYEQDYVGEQATSVVIDMGIVDLRRGESGTVFVNKRSEPVANANVLVMPYNDWYSTDFTGSCAETFSEKTNEDGFATFGNLDPYTPYIVFVPRQDLNGDGVPDIDPDGDREYLYMWGEILVAVEVYEASQLSDTYVEELSIRSTALWNGALVGVIKNGDPAVEPLARADLSGRASVTSASYQSYSLRADGSVRVYFSGPSVVHAGLSAGFEYSNVLIDPSSATFNKTIFVPITATAVPGTGDQVWDVVPTQPLPLGVSFRLSFNYASKADPVDLQTWSSSGLFRAATNGVTGLKIDNYNGARADGAARRAWLETSAPIWGDVSVVKITRADSTIYESSDSWTLTDSFNSVVFNQDVAPATDVATGQLGTTPGLRFRYDLRPWYWGTMPALADGDKVELKLAIRDATDGSRIERVVLTVE